MQTWLYQEHKRVVVINATSQSIQPWLHDTAALLQRRTTNIQAEGIRGHRPAANVWIKSRLASLAEIDTSVVLKDSAFRLSQDLS